MFQRLVINKIATGQDIDALVKLGIKRIGNLVSVKK